MWRYDGSEELEGYFTEPVGAAFAVMIKKPGDTTLHPTVSIVMVMVDGKSFGIPGQYIRP